jgi:hypothetical protein
MLQRYFLIGLLALTALIAAAPAPAQSGDANYDIMKPEPGEPQELPEPWLPPKYKSPRGSREHVVIPRPSPAPRPQAQVPPPIYVPGSGRALPNLPTPAPSGPGGTETYQDRAVRCAHQAGLYGQAAGDRSTYIGTCINQ